MTPLRKLFQRSPQMTAALVYASEEEIASLFEPRGCASSPTNKLQRLRERVITREEVELECKAMLGMD